MQRYDAKRFLQTAPADLLQRYLTGVGLTGRIDWSASPEHLTGAVFAAIEQVPEELHRQIHRAFGMIHRLSNEEGITMIRDEIHRRHMEQQTIPAMEQYPTVAGQAFWTFLNEPDVFSVAYHFGIADIVQRWHRVCVRASKSLAPMPESATRLEDDLRSYYQECQGRGYGCTVYVYPRDSRCYWFAYVQDYAKDVLLYDVQHQLQTEALELAFLIIFIYDHQAGTLAIATDGDLEHLMDLQRLFGRAILDEEIPHANNGETFHIQRLLDRHHPLPLYPNDKVASVHVQSISIEFLGQRRTGLTVTAGRDEHNQRVYDLLDKALSGFQMPRDLVTVAQVEMYVTFRPDGGLQPRPRVIRITPRGCACTQSPWDDVIRELLRRWGIYDAAPCPEPTEGD